MLDNILSDRDLMVDWLKVGTMLIVSRLLAGGDLTNETWMMTSLYTLLGFTTYHIVTKKLVQNNLENDKMVRVLNTWLKVGSMLLVSRLISGKDLNESWMMNSLYTILGFNVVDVFVMDFLPLDEIDNEPLRDTVKDAVTVGTMSSVSLLLSGGEFNNQWLMSTLYTILGFTAYNFGTKHLLN